MGRALKKPESLPMKKSGFCAGTLLGNMYSTEISFKRYQSPAYTKTGLKQLVQLF